MTDQQHIYLNQLLQFYAGFAVIMGYYCTGKKYRYVAYFRTPVGILYVQYLVEY